jgi:hypothetical protein
VTLVMARCIGRADCDREPNGGRGLCTTCYAFHYQRGTIGNFPTMRERTAQLRAAGQMHALDTQRVIKQRTHATNWRVKQHKMRVELDGRLVHPGNCHGRVNGYTAMGCRGSMCYAAWCHYKATGECRLPEALSAEFSAEDCVLYRSDVYPDRRR